MIWISVFTGLLPFVLLLQCPMSVILLLYIPLLQCRCSTVVCYWSTAHVFCAWLYSNALPKVRLSHAFARLVSRSFDIVAMVLRNHKALPKVRLVLLNWGFWLVAMVTKCTVEVTIDERSNALPKVRQKLSFFFKSLSSDQLSRGIRWLSGYFFFLYYRYHRYYRTTIDCLLDFRFLTKQTLYAVTDSPPSISIRDPLYLSLIHIWRCRRSYACRSRWSPYH